MSNNETKDWRLDYLLGRMPPALRGMLSRAALRSLCVAFGVGGTATRLRPLLQGQRALKGAGEDSAAYNAALARLANLQVKALDGLIDEVAGSFYEIRTDFDVNYAKGQRYGVVVKAGRAGTPGRATTRRCATELQATNLYAALRGETLRPPNPSKAGCHAHYRLIQEMIEPGALHWCRLERGHWQYLHARQGVRNPRWLLAPGQLCKDLARARNKIAAHRRNAAGSAATHLALKATGVGQYARSREERGKWRQV